jgi:hypothetical protein
LQNIQERVWIFNPQAKIQTFAAPRKKPNTLLELVWNFFKLKTNSLWFWINKNQGVYRDK